MFTNHSQFVILAIIFSITGIQVTSKVPERDVSGTITIYLSTAANFRISYTFHTQSPEDTTTAANEEHFPLALQVAAFALSP